MTWSRDWCQGLLYVIKGLVEKLKHEVVYDR